MRLLSRENVFRCLVVLLLIALLLCAVLPHAGSVPALLPVLFVFLFLLTVNECPPTEAATRSLTDVSGTPQPTRAP